MDNTTIYIIISLIAGVFLMVHLWEELTDTYMNRREELDEQYYDGKITLREYEDGLRELREEMEKGA